MWEIGTYYPYLIAAAVLAAGLTAGIRLYIHRLVERQIARYQDDLTRKHCEEVENMYRQTRGWRHDFKNHLQTMLAYLELEQTVQLARYIRELTQDYNTIDVSQKTGNAMLDAILGSKLSIMKNREIRVHADALVPANLTLSDVDLSVLIGNLLDNAMEACLNVPPNDRFVRLYITRAKDNLYIYVMTSAGGIYRRHQGNYLSTKPDSGHGYGLWRIDKVVKKYNGCLNRQDEGDVFATEILLPL